MSKNLGMIHKYHVTRLTKSSTNTDHTHCAYWVLDPQHDPMAYAALAAYAASARANGYERLADDLYEWLAGVEAPEQGGPVQ